MDFDYKKKVNAIDRRKQCEQILQFQLFVKKIQHVK